MKARQGKALSFLARTKYGLYVSWLGFSLTYKVPILRCLANASPWGTGLASSGPHVLTSLQRILVKLRVFY